MSYQIIKKSKSGVYQEATSSMKQLHLVGLSPKHIHPKSCSTWYSNMPQVLRENRMIDRCVRKDATNCDPSHITRDRRVSGDVTWCQNDSHAPVNHMVFFLCMVFLYLCI